MTPEIKVGDKVWFRAFIINEETQEFVIEETVTRVSDSNVFFGTPEEGACYPLEIIYKSKNEALDALINSLDKEQAKIERVRGKIFMSKITEVL